MNATSVSAGDDQTVILKSDGTVWAIGSNVNGALGDGSGQDSTLPVQVMRGVPPNTVPLTNVIQVVCGGSNFSLALKKDGTVWAWGQNGSGQLGVGDTVSRATATQVPVPGGASRIAAGAYHSIALSKNGHVYGWGYNGYGQLGLGAVSSPVNRLSPVQMLETNGNTRVTEIAAGMYFNMLRQAWNDAVYTVGDNQSGQLAVGSNTQKNVPVQSNY